MALYQLSPYVHFVENRLLPNTIQYGIFHQLTGYIIEPRESVRAMLFAVRLGKGLSLADEDLEKLAADGAQIRELIEQRILISFDDDPLAAFLDHVVVRPVQNPALVYRHESGEIKLVRTSMSRRTYSPRRDELPSIVEEPMPPIAANGNQSRGEKHPRLSLRRFQARRLRSASRDQSPHCGLSPQGAAVSRPPKWALEDSAPP